MIKLKHTEEELWDAMGVREEFKTIKKKVGVEMVKKKSFSEVVETIANEWSDELEKVVGLLVVGLALGDRNFTLALMELGHLALEEEKDD